MANRAMDAGKTTSTVAASCGIGFSEVPVSESGPVEEQVYRSWYQYFTETLGRSREAAHERAMAEVSRKHASWWCQHLRDRGWPLQGMKILDVGSGHGTLAIELARAGAEVTALEPCDAWRILSAERAGHLGLNITHLAGDAERLPFGDGTFDGCVSLQVLEHVGHPKNVIFEIARVLKPSGRCLVSCENYLAFQEPHYGVAWVPFLPKWMGAGYLRLRGRHPEFLRDHITYVYWPRLARDFIDAGLWHHDWLDILRYVEEGEGGLRLSFRAFYELARRVIGKRRATVMLVCARNRRRIFASGFSVDGILYENRCCRAQPGMDT